MTGIRLHLPAIGFFLLMTLSRLANGDDRKTNEKVAAQGRIEPDGGVIKLAAPYSFSAPQIVTELLVKMGDALTKGQRTAPREVGGDTGEVRYYK